MNNEINLKDYYAQRNLMYMATIELTTKCNWNCIHCFLNSKICSGLKTNEIFKLLNELRDMGVYEVQFTGGEIFTRNDILDIIEYARHLYFKVVLLTNLSLLNEKIIKKLDILGIETVSTTLFSLNNDVNDKITQSTNSSTIILNNIDLLLKTNIRTEIKTIVMKHNYEDYKNIKQYCSDKGIRFIATEGLFPTFDGSIEPREYALSYDQLYSSICDFDCIRYGSLYKKNKDNSKNICCELNYSLFISATGIVYPCNLWFKKIGDIHINTINEIWHSSFLKEIKSKKWKDLTKCRKCDKRDYCIRCSGIVEALSGNYLLNDSFACRTAEIRKKIYEGG